jgi:signal transduction histidine kinase
MDVVPGVDQAAGRADLVTHIQDRMEDAKTALARVLHDEVGGLMVAALMDLTWVENHLSKPQTGSTEKLKRIKHSLRAAIDLERQIVEELRPTLLDQVGLFAALKWQVNARCAKAKITSSDHLPAMELDLRPAASIALYRIAEESLNIILKRTATAFVSLEVNLSEASIHMRFADDGTIDMGRPKATDQCLAALRHRVTILGGELQIQECVPRGSLLNIRVPLAKAMMAETMALKTFDAN